MKIITPSARLLTCTPNPLYVIEYAARISHKGEGLADPDNVNIAFLRSLIKRGHMSVFRHASASFHIITDRGISHQLIRHAVGTAVIQESTRYNNYSKGKYGNEITVIMPSELSNTRYELGVWYAAVTNAEKSYFSALDSGMSTDEARSVLPTCLKTELLFTANFEEWRHILCERYVNKHAHADFRLLMKDVYLWFQNNYPVVVENLIPESN